MKQTFISTALLIALLPLSGCYRHGSNSGGPDPLAIISEEEKPILVDFYATWCLPCKQLEPILEAVAEEKPKSVIVKKIDVDKHPKTAAKYNVLRIPTVILFQGAKEIGRFEGIMSKEDLVAFITKKAK